MVSRRIGWDPMAFCMESSTRRDFVLAVDVLSKLIYVANPSERQKVILDHLSIA